ncbi:MAG: hypothetical protein U0031_00605 [Thermomicrobiales bacterium]
MADAQRFRARAFPAFLLFLLLVAALGTALSPPVSAQATVPPAGACVIPKETPFQVRMKAGYRYRLACIDGELILSVTKIKRGDKRRLTLTPPAGDPDYVVTRVEAVSATDSDSGDSSDVDAESTGDRDHTACHAEETP